MPPLNKCRHQAMVNNVIIDMFLLVKTMNDNLLRELLLRWDASSLGFRVGVRTLVFKHLDVCLALGFPIVGDLLSELIDRDSHCRILFDINEAINVKSVHSKLMVLQDGENIEDFCRVYILFALGLFRKHTWMLIITNFSLSLLMI